MFFPILKKVFNDDVLLKLIQTSETQNVLENLVLTTLEDLPMNSCGFTFLTI